MPETPFADRLAEACRKKDSVVCVGIDPRVPLLPAEFREGRGDTPAERAEAIADWATELLDVIAPLAPIVKPQLAFFEKHGWAGYRAYERTVSAARERGLLVLADAKRGDIGSTAEAYAAAHLGPSGPDAMTVNPYLGRDTLEPFLDRCRDAGKGIFVLVKTSNPGSADLQGRTVDGRPLHEHVADLVRDAGDDAALVGASGYSSVGAVVGATYPDELRTLRAAMPRTPLLVPGYGAQGARAEDCALAFDEARLGAICNSSRGITFAFRGAHAEEYGESRWRASVEAATIAMRDALNAAHAAGARPA